ncbi:MAG: hypothetical protein ACQCXQ_14275 [Verrucomicrobiales bacterium]|nr:hypothetical protein [Verrucomicrobiota bacterium JB025]
MKTILMIPLGVSVLALSGCERQERVVEADFADAFELVEDVQLDHHWSVVRRLSVRGRGVHSITIGDGMRGGVSLSPNDDPANEIMMVFMVDPGKRVATWWITDWSRDADGGTSGRAGAPRSFTYSENAKYLTDVVEFLDVAGRHKLGEGVPLVRFLDAAAGESEIVLRVD